MARDHRPLVLVVALCVAALLSLSQGEPLACGGFFFVAAIGCLL